MNVPKSTCPHIITIGDYTKEDIIERQESTCDSCENSGPNLWICLHRECLYIGCSDSSHSVKHFQRWNEHSLFLNLTTLRVYCLLCECEVFLENNDPPIPGMLPSHPLITKSDSESEDEFEANEDGMKPRGLTGLQNLGNTCYMNSAIQSLSNCPQLTNFFLECGSFVRSDKKPGLAKTYMKLMREMWHRKRPSYVVPSGIAYGIKVICPVFRGYTQQDAQEFLRCFLDQLHEELKEPVIELPSINGLSPETQEDFSVRADSGLPVSDESSQSDADYETCDSGLSSEKSSCDDETVESPEASTDPLDSVCSSYQSSQLKKQDASSFCEAVSSERDSMLSPDVSRGSPEIVSFQSPLHTSPQQCKKTIHTVSRIPKSVNTTKKCKYNEVSTSSKENGNIRNNRAASVSTSDITVCCEKADPLCRKEEKVSKSEAAGGDPDDSFDFRNDVKSANQMHSSEKISHSSTFPSNHISSSKIPCAVRQNPHKPLSSLLNSLIPGKKRKPVQYRSIISDVFDGKILSSVQCLTCDTVSTTKETFQDLSLPIPNRDHLNMIHASQGNQQKSGGTCTDVYSHQGWFTALFGWMISWFWGPSISLLDCLSAFFSADELKGDNMYSCEKCKKLRNGIKYSKVIELPEVLCIHLKRFRHEVMFSSKIGSYVSFPLESLDMSPFLHKSYPRGVTTYDLASVICHHGTAGSGHYTAYSLNYLNDQWYEFDDQYVTAVDAEVVRHCEAYVLFYRKSSEDIIKKRQCAVELMNRSKTEHGLLNFHISKQWINKFNNFAEPGPITNTDFLCIHGGVPPQKAPYAEELCTVLPQAVWEYLHDTFGGGPSCTHLYVCPICQTEQDALKQKRKLELDEFIATNLEFNKKDNPVIYAISMTWFKTWETFVCKDGDPPGPIDNSSICYIKNNQAVLKLGSDYCSVSKEMYQYFQSIYGGGPDIPLQSNTNVVSLHCPQFTSSGSTTCHTKSSTVCSNVQSVQVHSGSRVNSSSHTQSPHFPAAKPPCDVSGSKNAVVIESVKSSSSEDK